jgi:ABC-2 type transport system permease protein
VNASDSLIALYGRVYDPASLGAVSLLKLSAFGAALVAVLMIVITVRHTRAEEEAGRLELLGAGVLGRSAPLAAALLVGALASLILGVLTGLSLVLAGLPFVGSFAFGVGWAATGLAFATVAAVAVQVASSARSAIGVSLVILALTYVLRAVGDLSSPPSVLSWLSPIGWNQQIRAFAGDRLWVVVLPLLLSAVLIPVAFALRSRRDLGSGLIPDRPGPAHGSLTGPWSLAVRMQRGLFLGWAVAFALFGLLLGSIASNVSGFLTSPNIQEIIQALGGEQALVDAFLAAEIGLMGVILAAYGIAAVGHLHAEEAAGRAELLLSTKLSRVSWALSHVLSTAAAAALLSLIAGVAIGVGNALAIGDASGLVSVIGASLAHLPAVWVFTALVLTFFGLLPRLVGIVWVLYAAAIVLGEFGPLWRVPQWLMNLSPFVHSPTLPAPFPTGVAVPLTTMTIVAISLVAIGLAAWQRRDLVSS